MFFFFFTVTVNRDFPKIRDLYGPEMFFGYNIFIMGNQMITLRYNFTYMDGSTYSAYHHPTIDGTLTFDRGKNQTIVSSLVDVTEHEHLCPPAEGVQQKCFSLKFRVRNIASDMMVNLKFWVRQQSPCPIDVEDYESFLLHPTEPSTDPSSTDPSSTDPPSNSTNTLSVKAHISRLAAVPAVQLATFVMSIFCIVFFVTTVVLVIQICRNRRKKQTVFVNKYCYTIFQQLIVSVNLICSVIHY